MEGDLVTTDATIALKKRRLARILSFSAAIMPRTSPSPSTVPCMDTSPKAG